MNVKLPSFFAVILVPALLMVMLSAEISQAASTTWLSSPIDDTWSDPRNWTQNGPGDTATFATSTITDIDINLPVAVHFGY